MSVEFNDEQQKARILYARFQSSSQEPALVGWLIRKGIVKNASQANFILLGITALGIIIAIFIVSRYVGRI